MWRACGLIAASVSALFVRKDVAKDVDPQLEEISERLGRIEEGLRELRSLDETPRSVEG